MTIERLFAGVEQEWHCHVQRSQTSRKRLAMQAAKRWRCKHFASLTVGALSIAHIDVEVLVRKGDFYGKTIPPTSEQWTNEYRPVGRGDYAKKRAM
jgi:hypothetical protein